MSDLFKRNVKLACKSVYYHFWQYFCFFIALFIVQMFFGIITIAFDNNNKIEYRYIAAEYDYHVLLKDLNNEQYIYLMNGGGAVFSSDLVYEIHEVVDRGGGKYDFYLRFMGEDVNADYERFRERYGQELVNMNEDGLRYTKSPLMTFENNLSTNRVAYVLIACVLALLSVFLVTALYNIRINHYKFTYGVYMTFGADFKKLFQTSFWEMMVVASSTLIPSFLCSVLTDFIIYRVSGEAFFFHWTAPLKVLLFSFFVAAASVLYPIWRLSKKTPMSLVVAEDNSNLVISPRRSFELFRAKFPEKYEMYSLWRFRKYYVQLFLTAVIFSVIFTCTAFYANMYRTKLDYDVPQFQLTMATTGYAYYYDAIMRDELYAIEGVTNVEKTLSINAAELRSHILVPRSMTRMFTNYAAFDDDRSQIVTNEVSYMAADEEMVNFLSQYDHIGDLNSILTQENTIIISDSINNTSRFKYQPGNTIRVAIYKDKIRDADSFLSGKELLKSELRFYSFDYVEYTIGAVLLNNPTYERMPLYFSESDYELVTGDPVEFRNVAVYVDNELSSEEVRTLESNLRDWADTYNNITVTNTHKLSERNIENGKSFHPMIWLIGALVLVISPLVWFFSQTMFYLKRENEFTILQAIGGVIGDIKKIYWIDGLFAAAASTVLYLLLTHIGFYAIFKVVNVFITKFSRDFSIRYIYSTPWIPLLLSAALCVICGFLSAYTARMAYAGKRAASGMADEFSGEDS